MEYSKIVKVYEKLEGTTSKLEKRDILAEFFKKVSTDDLPNVVLLASGEVFPKKEKKDLGIAGKMMRKIIERVCGVSEKEFNKKYKDTGDLGLTAAHFLRFKKQQALGKKGLSVEKVVTNLRKLPDVTGAGSQERKMDLVAEILSSAIPDEAVYLVRTILGEMRIGVAEGIVRDAIAKAFGQNEEDVEHAYNLLGDYGLVAELAKKNKLGKVNIILGEPIRVMLAEKAPDLETAVKKFDKPAEEIKLDGFRTQVHKQGKKIKIFSRRMDDVTKQFPELVKWSKECIKAENAIIEGETLAIDPKTGDPQPFQKLSRRIQRKYDIEKMVKEIPIQINLFDLLYVNGRNYMKEPLEKRWSKLMDIVKEKKGKFVLVEHIETKDLKKANDFYQNALKMGEEGIIVKNLEAHYQPGKRVGYWLKVKPIMEPLDLVIIEAEWGRGKRAGWLSSFTLAAKHDTKFVPVGKMGTGLSDKQFKELTKTLKDLIIEEMGRKVKLKPEVVVEVGYEEIQHSPNYESGYALRFPRLLRIRDPKDKGPEDADTVKRIKRLYKQQRGKGKK